jgi:predicted ArsR family transcriptional regulator
VDRMVERDGRAAAVEMLELLRRPAHRLNTELAGSSLAERLQALGRVLSEEGYMAEVSVGAAEGTLTEHNCAIPAVAERFPEICAAEARFVAEVLGARVDRRAHMLTGCSACEYHVRLKPAEENT